MIPLQSYAFPRRPPNGFTTTVKNLKIAVCVRSGAMGRAFFRDEEQGA